MPREQSIRREISRLRRTQRRNIVRHNRDESAWRIRRKLHSLSRRFKAIGSDLFETQYDGVPPISVDDFFPDPIFNRHDFFVQVGRDMKRVGRVLEDLHIDLFQESRFRRYSEMIAPLKEVFNEMRAFRFCFRKYSQLIREPLRRTLVPQFNALDVAVNGFLRDVENQSHTSVRVNSEEYDHILNEMHGLLFQNMELMMLEPDDELDMQSNFEWEP